MKKIKHWIIYRTIRGFKNLFVNTIFTFYQEIKGFYAMFNEYYHDKKLGIQTIEEPFTKDDSKYKDMSFYMPLPYGTIRKAIETLDLKSNDIFVDLGCGKGRAIFTAAMKGPKKVIGVELNTGLLDMAGQNLAALKAGHSPVEFINADAAKFYPTEGTVFFMFCPFGHKTMVEVARNIKKSFLEYPRKIRIAYYGPAHRYVFDDEEWLEIEKVVVIDKVEMVVWRSVN